MPLLKVSPSPHDHSGESVSRLMYGVLIALLPAIAASLYYFGVGVIIITASSMASCAAFEYLIQKYLLKQKPSIRDGSALVTGMLLAFCLPANIPVWMVVLGSFVAIAIGKMSFGGLGNNPFNPALVGRVFLFISFPVKNGEPISHIMQALPGYLEMLAGKMGGSAGEVAAVAILAGFIYLLARKIITWHIPVSIIMTVFIFTGILWLANPGRFADPLFHLLAGGLMLGAVFMATDYVTSPMTHKGMLIYGAGIGIITVLIRIFGAYPEGVQFAILIMNAFVPLINKYIKPDRFGS
jgi:electron transport complex protein RnfD